MQDRGRRSGAWCVGTRPTQHPLQPMLCIMATATRSHYPMQQTHGFCPCLPSCKFRNSGIRLQQGHCASIQVRVPMRFDQSPRPLQSDPMIPCSKFLVSVHAYHAVNSGIQEFAFSGALRFHPEVRVSICFDQSPSVWNSRC